MVGMAIDGSCTGLDGNAEAGSEEVALDVVDGEAVAGEQDVNVAVADQAGERGRRTGVDDRGSHDDEDLATALPARTDAGRHALEQLRLRLFRGDVAGHEGEAIFVDGPFECADPDAG